MQVAKAKMYIVSCIPINFQGNMLVSVTDNSTSTLFFWCVHLCSFLKSVHRTLVYTHKAPETFLRAQKSYKTWKRILVMSESWLQGPEHARRHSTSYKSSVMTENVFEKQQKVLKLIFFFGKSVRLCIRTQTYL